jgi:hypothetical protein
MSELCNASKIEVVKHLKFVLNIKPELGRYHEFEEVFIRDKFDLTDDLVSNLVSRILDAKFGDGKRA